MKKTLTAILCLWCALPAFPANWYVDVGAGGANDGTSWTDAWTDSDQITWGTGGVVAGDTLYLSAGTSGQTKVYKQLIPGASGTWDNWIKIHYPSDSGHNGGNIVISNRLAFERSYIEVDGRPNQTGTYEDAKIKIHRPDDTTTYSVYVKNISGPSKLIGLEVVNESTTLSSFSNKTVYWDLEKAAYSADPTNQSVFAHCYVHDSFGDGLHMVDFHAASGYGETMLVLGNLVTNCGGNGMIIGQNTTVVSNIVVNPDPTKNIGEHRDGLETYGEYLQIEKNQLGDWGTAAMMIAPAGSASTTLSNIRIWNNVITRTNSYADSQRGIQIYATPVGGTFTGGSPYTLTSENLVIANNTFSGFTTYMSLYTRRRTGESVNYSNWVASANVRIENNIFSNTGTTDGDYVVQIGGWTDYTGFTFRNNSIEFNSRASGNAVLYAATAYGSASALNSGESTASGNVDTVVTFIDASNFDFNLDPADTGARGLGLDLSSYFTDDKDNNTRSAWDIGAFEFQSVAVAAGSGRRNPSRGRGAGVSGVGF